MNKKIDPADICQRLGIEWSPKAARNELFKRTGVRVVNKSVVPGYTSVAGPTARMQSVKADLSRMKSAPHFVVK